MPILRLIAICLSFSTASAAFAADLVKLNYAAEFDPGYAPGKFEDGHGLLVISRHKQSMIDLFDLEKNQVVLSIPTTRDFNPTLLKTYLGHEYAVLLRQSPQSAEDSQMIIADLSTGQFKEIDDGAHPFGAGLEWLERSNGGLTLVYASHLKDEIRLFDMAAFKQLPPVVRSEDLLTKFGSADCKAFSGFHHLSAYERADGSTGVVATFECRQQGSLGYYAVDWNPADQTVRLLESKANTGANAIWEDVQFHRTSSGELIAIMQDFSGQITVANLTQQTSVDVAGQYALDFLSIFESKDGAVYVIATDSKTQTRANVISALDGTVLMNVEVPFILTGRLGIEASLAEADQSLILLAESGPRYVILDINSGSIRYEGEIQGKSPTSKFELARSAVNGQLYLLAQSDYKKEIYNLSQGQKLVALEPVIGRLAFVGSIVLADQHLATTVGANSLCIFPFENPEEKKCMPSELASHDDPYTNDSEYFTSSSGELSIVGMDYRVEIVPGDCYGQPCKELIGTGLYRMRLW